MVICPHMNESDSCRFELPHRVIQGVRRLFIIFVECSCDSQKSTSIIWWGVMTWSKAISSCYLSKTEKTNSEIWRWWMDNSSSQENINKLYEDYTLIFSWQVIDCRMIDNIRSKYNLVGWYPKERNVPDQCYNSIRKKCHRCIMQSQHNIEIEINLRKSFLGNEERGKKFSRIIIIPQQIFDYCYLDMWMHIILSRCHCVIITDFVFTIFQFNLVTWIAAV